MIYPGIIGKIMFSVPETSAEGMKSARYWRLDNIVRHSSSTQIYGFAFHGSGFGSISKLEPISIVNDSGNMTTDFNHSKIGGDSGGGVDTIDAYTFFNFDFGVSVAPDRLEIWGWEWDVDYIVSCDISWSDNNTTWNKVGEFHADTQMSRINANNQAVFCRHIWSESGIQFSNASLSVVHGRTADGVFLNRPTTTVIVGRTGENVFLNRPVITVIDKPV